MESMGMGLTFGPIVSPPALVRFLETGGSNAIRFGIGTLLVFTIRRADRTATQRPRRPYGRRHLHLFGLSADVPCARINP